MLSRAGLLLKNRPARNRDARSRDSGSFISLLSFFEREVSPPSPLSSLFLALFFFPLTPLDFQHRVME